MRLSWMILVALATACGGADGTNPTNPGETDTDAGNTNTEDPGDTDTDDDSDTDIDTDTDSDSDTDTRATFDCATIPEQVIATRGVPNAKAYHGLGFDQNDQIVGQDSNLNLKFRKLLFYPLNYGAKSGCKSRKNH